MKISHIAAVVCAAATIATVAASTRAHAAGSCRTVAGTYVANQYTTGCTSPTGICFSGTVSGGELAGTTNFIELDQAPSAGMPLTEPGTTVSYSGTLTFTTPANGTLTVRDLGVIDGARTSYTELERPVGGTGQFANGTGTFFISGTMNAALTQFDGKLTGQICGLLIALRPSVTAL